MTGLTQDRASDGVNRAPGGRFSPDSRRRTGSAGDAALSGRRPSGFGGRLSEETRSRIIGRIRQGATQQRLVLEFGISRSTVHRLRCLANGEPYGRVSKDAIPLPAWLPRWLYDDYTRLGRLYGEERAASECRRLKAEAALYDAEAGVPREKFESAVEAPLAPVAEPIPLSSLVGKRRVNQTDLEKLRGMASVDDAMPDIAPLPVGARLKGRVVAEGECLFRLIDLLNITIAATRVSGEKILSPTRKAHIARARQVLFWLARKHSGVSLSQIGGFVGRDHTSVISGAARAEAVAQRLGGLHSALPAEAAQRLWAEHWSRKPYTATQQATR